VSITSAQIAQKGKDGGPVEGVCVGGCGVVGAHGAEDCEGLGEETRVLIEGLEVEEVEEGVVW
jgi:hypothetical protein